MVHFAVEPALEAVNTPTRRSLVSSPLKLQSCAVALAAAMTATTAIAGPVTDLPGRWSGWGSVQLANGSSEQLRCVATYLVEDRGITVKQNLRCASQGYKIDASSNLTLNGAQVSGAWEEKTWSTTGTISGRMLNNGFTLTIEGLGFSAGMAVNTSNCKQTINIIPVGFDVSKVSMNLSKC